MFPSLVMSKFPLQMFTPHPMTAEPNCFLSCFPKADILISRSNNTLLDNSKIQAFLILSTQQISHVIGEDRRQRVDMTSDQTS